MKTVAIILLAALLNGCAISGNAPDSFCAVAQPIYTSCDDQFTESTALQVLDHNDVGEQQCGWKPKAKKCPGGEPGQGDIYRPVTP